MFVPDTVNRQRRAELAAFLRSRRALVSPEDAGLPPGPRRRTPGLRREELAQLAGVGVTWYTWLEQGRPINASVQVLDAVAAALRLDRTEHVHLYRLADVPEVKVPPADAVVALPPDTQTVLDAISGIPACIYNGKYDVLAWNATFAALFPSLIADEEENRNALWYAFARRAGENPLGSTDCLAHMVATVRSTYAHHIGEPAWTGWVERMSRHSKLFATFWASNRVSSSLPVVRELSCAERTVRVRTMSFAVAGAVETRMVVQVPERDADVEFFKLIQNGS